MKAPLPSEFLGTVDPGQLLELYGSLGGLPVHFRLALVGLILGAFALRRRLINGKRQWGRAGLVGSVLASVLFIDPSAVISSRKPGERVTMVGRVVGEKADNQGAQLLVCSDGFGQYDLLAIGLELRQGEFFIVQGTMCSVEQDSFVKAERVMVSMRIPVPALQNGDQ